MNIRILFFCWKPPHCQLFQLCCEKEVRHRRVLEVLPVHRKSEPTFEVFLLKVEQGDFYIHGIRQFFKIVLTLRGCISVTTSSSKVNKTVFHTYFLRLVVCTLLFCTKVFTETRSTTLKKRKTRNHSISQLSKSPLFQLLKQNPWYTSKVGSLFRWVDRSRRPDRCQTSFSQGTWNSWQWGGFQQNFAFLLFITHRNSCG